MRKIIFILLTAFISAGTYSQNVGIGTNTPETRLHVVDLINDVHLKVESPAVGTEARLSLLAGNNPFSFLQFSKWSAGATGSLAGISKDNLGAISTGGNAGPLLFYTGDGVSPLLFAAGSGERMRVQSNGQVSIGTSTPASSGKLHVHDDIANQDVSIVMTNSLTGANNLRGMRLRLLNSDVILHNYEATGKFHVSTNFNIRLTVDAAGNVGIGETNPNAYLHIKADTGPALNLENGAIKVSGTNRTAFQHTATAGNIFGNETVIPNTTLANSATDMLFVTPVWEGVYVNASIGVYFSAGTWRIFRQDLANMPLNAKFNVLVVKQ